VAQFIRSTLTTSGDGLLVLQVKRSCFDVLKPCYSGKVLKDNRMNTVRVLKTVLYENEINYNEVDSDLCQRGDSKENCSPVYQNEEESFHISKRSDTNDTGYDTMMKSARETTKFHKSSQDDTSISQISEPKPRRCTPRMNMTSHFANEVINRRKRKYTNWRPDISNVDEQSSYSESNNSTMQVLNTAQLKSSAYERIPNFYFTLTPETPQLYMNYTDEITEEKCTINEGFFRSRDHSGLDVINNSSRYYYDDDYENYSGRSIMDDASFEQTCNPLNICQTTSNSEKPTYNNVSSSTFNETITSLTAPASDETVTSGHSTGGTSPSGGLTFPSSTVNTTSFGVSTGGSVASAPSSDEDSPADVSSDDVDGRRDEFFRLESNYVEYMMQGMQAFSRPLRQRSILSAVQYRTIFQNIEKVN